MNPSTSLRRNGTVLALTTCLLAGGSVTTLGAASAEQAAPVRLEARLEAQRRPRRCWRGRLPSQPGHPAGLCRRAVAPHRGTPGRPHPPQVRLRGGGAIDRLGHRRQPLRRQGVPHPDQPDHRAPGPVLLQRAQREVPRRCDPGSPAPLTPAASAGYFFRSRNARIAALASSEPNSDADSAREVRPERVDPLHQRPAEQQLGLAQALRVALGQRRADLVDLAGSGPPRRRPG